MNKVTVKKTNKVSVFKMDEERRIVKGAVYVPYAVDTQGDFMTPEEIEKTAHQFMADLNVYNIDTQHNFQAVDAHVCESFIVTKSDDEWPQGSWVIAVKINDDGVWEGISKGDYEAFSMAGVANRYYDVEITAEG